jgi:heme/copper-type cytochrome/quinol oxidase subunit 2
MKISYNWLNGAEASGLNLSSWGQKPTAIPTDIRENIMNATNFVLYLMFFISLVLVLYGVSKRIKPKDKRELYTANRFIILGVFLMIIAGLIYAMITVTSCCFLTG